MSAPLFQNTPPTSRDTSALATIKLEVDHLLLTQAHLGDVGSYIHSLRVGPNLGLQLGMISLPLLGQVGVRSLLFYRRRI
jgi:hypothetical protein